MNIQDALIKGVLERWTAYSWTMQGFGFLRTNIADIGRIHVWDSRLRTPLVSDIHTHPWALRSTVVSGELINQRFHLVNEDEEETSDATPYLVSGIATGEGGGLIGDTKEVWLRPMTPEIYVRGQSYKQMPSEIHRSIPADGTVTVLERPKGPELEPALVYWPYGSVWVSAEPKSAPSYLVEQVIGWALARWCAAP